MTLRGGRPSRVLIPRHVNAAALAARLDPRVAVELLTLDFTTSRPVWADVLVGAASRLLPYERAIPVISRYGGRVPHFSVDGVPLDGARGDIDVLLATWAFDRNLAASLIPMLPAVTWLHSSVIGIEYLPLDLLRQRGVTVTSPRGVHASRIAEYVIGFLLAESKQLFAHQVATLQRQTVRPRSRNAGDVTVGIVGYGGIGRAVATMARAVGMPVVALTRGRGPVRCENGVEEVPLLADVLRRADALVLALPTTQETRGLIDARALAQLRRGAIVVNVGRGDTLDFDALRKSLESGQVARACLDVVTDPVTGRPASSLPSKHPLFRVPNILFTSYTSSTSPQAEEELLDDFAARLNGWLRGEGPGPTADLMAGY